MVCRQVQEMWYLKNSPFGQMTSLITSIGILYSLTVFVYSKPLHQIQLIPVMRHRQRFSMAPGRRGEITFAQKRVGTCDCQADGDWGWCLKGKRWIQDKLHTQLHAHNYTHTYTYVYIYIYICVCVCVGICILYTYIDGSFVAGGFSSDVRHLIGWLATLAVLIRLSGS